MAAAIMRRRGGIRPPRRCALTDIHYYTELARTAEAGCFDSVFLADTLAAGDDVTHAPRTWLEPITVLAALAGVTSRIGLIATCSTTYTEPFNLARQFASIDHISNGRAGWNIVTTWLATASGNFGGGGPLSHADALRTRRRIHAGGEGAVGQLVGRRGAGRPRRPAIYARPGSIRADQPCTARTTRLPAR